MSFIFLTDVAEEFLGLDSTMTGDSTGVSDFTTDDLLCLIGMILVALTRSILFLSSFFICKITVYLIIQEEEQCLPR